MKSKMGENTMKAERLPCSFVDVSCTTNYSVNISGNYEFVSLSFQHWACKSWVICSRCWYMEVGRYEGGKLPKSVKTRRMDEELCQRTLYQLLAGI